MQFSKQLVLNVLSENHISISAGTRFVMHGHTPNVIYFGVLCEKGKCIIEHSSWCSNLWKGSPGNTKVAQSVKWAQIPISIK